jgi:hypothetical protein
MKSQIVESNHENRKTIESDMIQIFWMKMTDQTWWIVLILCYMGFKISIIIFEMYWFIDWFSMSSIELGIMIFCLITENQQLSHHPLFNIQDWNCFPSLLNEIKNRLNLVILRHIVHWMDLIYILIVFIQDIESWFCCPMCQFYE